MSDTPDYKNSFRQAVTQLVSQDMPVPWRVKAVDDLIEAYVAQVDEVPDGQQLEQLANYLLRDSVNQPDKVSRTEYPALNEGQWKLRCRREMSSEHVGVMATCSKDRMRKKRYYCESA
ncbi:hypothetical protein [Heliophilum fasciatum]|uniref:Uncharacterized protein n=1 Tax=Heliophilum fasciatum TaxID=35700 RepID=A0A4R2RBC9_9FIRM|nr:hypothetical protein [Heliophilum fasciatum]MCW2279239.1 hypothetical protein [Heliophilum fasciatum]TCP60630.1 hypothetical protein EDD73_13518 [Heliophilum fasciatum]